MSEKYDLNDEYDYKQIENSNDMDEEYDYKQIVGSNDMNKEDIEYFKKFGYSIAGQMELVAWESDLDPETMRDFDKLINNINNLTEDNAQYYIVETAQLACSEQTDEAQTFITVNGEITSTPKMNVENGKGGTDSLAQLRIPEDRAATYSIRKPAVATDTKGGIRDEIQKKLWGNEDEEGLNIISFGNCPYILKTSDLGDIAKELYKSTPALESASITEIEKKMVEAIEQGYGTCYCCMDLESQWENLPDGFYVYKNAFFYNKKNNESDQLSDGVEAINMMSMLFCKRGGIITAKESGQRIEFSTINEEIEDAIRQGLCTLEDFYYLVNVVAREDTTYDGRVAVTYEVLNRSKINNKSIKDVVTQKDAYRGFDGSQYGVIDEDTAEVVLAVLKGKVNNPIGDIQYHFGKIEGYDVWCESSKCSSVIVIGEGDLRNVFYTGTVHNMQTKKTDDAIVIYDSEKNEWLYDGVVIGG